MDFFKKHLDTLSILAVFAGALLWLNGKFNDIDRKFYEVDKTILTMKNDFDKRFSHIDRSFSEIDKEISIIKTVLIMKNVFPNELAKHCEQTKVEEPSK